MLRLVVPSKNLPKPSVDNFILVTTNEHDGQVDEVTISLTECIEADKLRGVTAPMPGVIVSKLTVCPATVYRAFPTSTASDCLSDRCWSRPTSGKIRSLSIQGRYSARIRRYDPIDSRIGDSIFPKLI